MTDRTVRVRLEAVVADYRQKFQTAIGDTRKLRDEVSQSALKQKEAWTQVGMAVGTFGAGMTATMGLAGKAAIDFESSFAGVRKTVTASEQQFAQLASGMRDMARSIPTNVNDLNAIGEAAGQLGIETPNLLGFTRTMADLGETTNLSAEEAATSLARLANITQMPQAEFDRLGSTIVALGNNFATTESEIVDMAMRIAGAGSQIGLAESDILAVSTALSSLGINAEAGGTAISKVMIDIASEVANGGEKLETFAGVAGMTAEQFSQAWREDAAAALGAFVTGLGSVEQSGGSTLQVLEELEITEVRMRDALLRASGAGDTWARTADTANDAWQANNALTEEAAQRYQTVSARIDIAKNAINDAGITIGQTFAPLVATAADTVSGLAGGIADLPGPAAAAVGAVGGLTGAVSLAAGGFLVAAPRIAETRQALDTLATSMPKTVSGLRTVGGILTGPWGLALAGGIAAIGYFAQAHADSEREIQAWTDTLDEQTGAISENTRAKALNDLETRGAVDAARDLGLSLETLTDAVLGDQTAVRDLDQDLQGWRVSLDEARDANGLLSPELNNTALAVGVVSGVVDDLNGQLSVSQRRQRENAESVAESEGRYLDLQHAMDRGLPRWAAMEEITNQNAQASREAGSAADDYAMGLDEVTGSAEQATSAVDGYLDALKAQTDPVFAAIRAAQGHRDALDELEAAQAEVNKLQAEGKTDTDEYREALDELRDANRNVASSAIDQRAALLGLTDVNGELNMTTAELVALLRELGVPPEVIEQTGSDLNDLLGLLEDISEARPDLNLNIDTDPARQALDAFELELQRLTGRQWWVSLDARGGRVARTPGGGGGITENHAGGWAGEGRPWSGPLRSDEVPIVAQKGEFVLSREMLRRLPRFHAGGPVDSSAVGQIVSSAVGGSSAQAAAAAAKILQMLEEFRRYERERSQNRARQSLVEGVDEARGAVGAADTAEARARATERLNDAVARLAEHDRDRVVAAAEAELVDAQATIAAEQRAAAEREALERMLRANREQWQFARMSTFQQIAWLDDRIRAEEKFSDEWMRLTEQRQRLADQVLAQRQRDTDAAVADLNRMLDERERINDQLEQSEQDHQDAMLRIRQDGQERIARAVEARRSDLLSSTMPDIGEGFGFSAGALAGALAAETAELEAWSADLDRLRGRGVSDAVVDLLGLDAGPEALLQIRELLGATEAELAALEREVAARQRAVDEQVRRERVDGASELASDILEIEEDMAERRADLMDEFLDRQRALTGELAAIGLDQGRTMSDAIRIGLASGMPALVDQVNHIRELLGTVGMLGGAGSATFSIGQQYIYAPATTAAAYGSAAADGTRQAMSQLLADARTG